MSYLKKITISYIKKDANNKELFSAIIDNPAHDRRK